MEASQSPSSSPTSPHQRLHTLAWCLQTNPCISLSVSFSLYFVVTISRRITAKDGLHLSTGHVIPRGSTIGFLNSISPYVYPPPSIRTPLDYCPDQPPLSQFYPWRSFEIRSLQGQEGAHQFVMTSPDNMNFGHGPGSCPGRFFAGAIVKITIMEILRRYDVALGPNGEGETTGIITAAVEPKDGTRSTFHRPANIVQPVSFQVLPDFTASIYFRKLEQVVPVTG